MFYTKCSTPKGVLDLHHQRIVEVTNECGPYQLFPIHNFSEEQVKGKIYEIVALNFNNLS